jgi:hypothetical protein
MIMTITENLPAKNDREIVHRLEFDETMVWRARRHFIFHLSVRRLDGDPVDDAGHCEEHTVLTHASHSEKLQTSRCGLHEVPR